MSSAGLVGYHHTKSLDGHVKLIRQQFRKGLADPELVRLVGKVTSGVGDWVNDPGTGKRVMVVSGWGKWYRMPMQPAVGKIRDDKADLARIWNFCILNVRYILDTDGVDVFFTPKEILERGAGDCDDFTILLGAMLTIAGFQTAARVISTDKRAWEHIYTLVAMPKEGTAKQWVPLDPTVEGKFPGWQYDARQKGAIRDFVLRMED